MAKLGQLVILAAALLLAVAFPSISAAYTEEEAPAKVAPAYTDYKAVEVVVEGIVYCQSCEAAGTGSLTAAKPIPSAKVSVVCKNHKNQVSFFKSYETDKKGYFYAELEGYVLAHAYVDHPLQACKVKLVSSPDEKCNLPTNVNGGVGGAPLRYENKRFVSDKYEAVIYAAGPVAFRPNECPPPTPY